MRNRYIFYYDPKAHGNKWQIFDRISKKQMYPFTFGIPTYNEQAQLRMLRYMGLESQWKSLWERKEARRIARIRKETELKFNQYDQSRQN